jgi:ATP-dependent protease ClpP protease subunit
MREIYIHGNNQKEELNDIDYLSSSAFYKTLHELERESNEDIIVHLHTIGGDLDDGLAIYDNILYSNCNISIIGHGCVYSVGTIIMQAAKKRFLMPNCSFMVHYGSCSISAEHKSAVNTIAYYKQQESKMIDIYADRCLSGNAFKGYDKEKVKRFITSKLDKNGDWYMSAEDAVYFGFADKVITKREYSNVRKINKRNNI